MILPVRANVARDNDKCVCPLLGIGLARGLYTGQPLVEKVAKDLEVIGKVRIFAVLNTKKDSMGGGYSERLPQEGERQNEAESCILERASAFANRVLKEIEALAGTTTCKSVQL